MGAQFCPVCWSNLALVGRSHNCIPRSRPSWIPADVPAPAKKCEASATPKPTKVARIEELKALCQSTGRAAASTGDVSNAAGVSNRGDAGERVKRWRAANRDQYNAGQAELMRRRRVKAKSICSFRKRGCESTSAMEISLSLQIAPSPSGRRVRHRAHRAPERCPRDCRRDRRGQPLRPP